MFDERTQARIDRADIGHGAALFDDVDMAAAHIDRPVAQGFRQHEAETVNIGPWRHVAAEESELFGRDIIIFAGEAAADDGAVVAEARRTGDAEVDDLGAAHVARRNDNIVGRHVAVDDAALMRRVQAGSNALHEPVDRLERQRPAAQHRRKALPVDKFHREIGAVENRIDREDVIAHDRFVIEIMERRGFLAEQSQSRFGLGHIGADQFDGDDVACLNRVALVDFAHAARGDGLVDLVDAVQLSPRRDDRPRGSKRGGLIHFWPHCAIGPVEDGKTTVEPRGA